MKESKRKNIDYNDNKDIVEPFCGACLAVPLAFTGVGASMYGSGKGTHKKRKSVIFWIGIVTAVISILIAFYYLFLSNCSDCR